MACFSIIFLSSCTSRHETLVKEGEVLARKYCSSCHMMPEPALLSKASWTNGVLPAMAEQLGIEVLQGNFYLNKPQSSVSAGDWAKIVKYYQALAPDTLVAPKNYSPPAKNLTIFNVKKPAEDTEVVSSTMIAFDIVNHTILTGNSQNPGLLRYDQDFSQKLVTPLPSTPIHLYLSDQQNGASIVTCMGGMRALDQTKGQVISLKNNNIQHQISSDLTRPIETLPVDYNKDGLTDYLVCAFGHHRGGLYMLKQLRDHSFQRVAVRELPGATHSYIRDFNGDGWPDIMTLFSHGDEGIWLFMNDKKGGFTQKNVLRFPPVFGSSSFQLIDMNHDGKPDIVYTAGDNSDYSRILKPYHGIYIFTNVGNYEFRQTFFYPVNGCMKAVAADFDLDGDMDIASIAFFADLVNKPEETFTYLEQTDGLAGKFRPAKLPIQQHGRWICMDANDWDGDGDTDIVLGNYSRGFLNQENLKPHWNLHLPFIVLENKTRDTKKR